MRTQILLGVLLCSCGPVRISETEFGGMAVPDKLVPGHCGPGHKVEDKALSSFCVDETTGQPDGVALTKNPSTATIRFYRQGTEVLFPLFYVDKAKTGTFVPDDARMQAHADSIPSPSLLLDYVERYPDAPNREKVQVRLIATEDLAIDAVPWMAHSTDDLPPCPAETGGAVCVEARKNVRAIMVQGKESTPSTVYQVYEHGTFYADEQAVGEAAAKDCAKSCGCPSGAWNSLEVAKAYCGNMDARLPTASEALGLVEADALPSSFVLTTTPFQPGSALDVRTKTPEDCETCDAAGGLTLVGANGLLDSSAERDDFEFLCVWDREPSSYPKLLTSRPELKPWRAPLARQSYGAQDTDYQDSVTRPGLPKDARMPPFDYGYKDIFMVSELLWNYHHNHPDITRLYSLGMSRGGYPILALRVAANPDDMANKPAVLINGSHHGDELLAVLFALKNLDFTLTLPPEDRASWLEAVDLWFVPLVNPDGNLVTLRRDRGRNIGRKNGNETDGQCGTDLVREGVDLNRNYPFMWGKVPKGSSKQPLSDYYRGTYPGSEPESQALMSLAAEHRFVAALSWHTNGTMIISPYTIPGPKNPEPDIAWEMAESFSAQTPAQPNGRKMAVKSSMYAVDGTDQDWHFNEHGTIAYIIEGSHHNPPDMALRRDSVEGLNPIYVSLMDWTLNGPSVSGRVVDEAGRPLEAKVQIRGHKLHQGETWTSRPSDGFFFRYLSEKAKRGSTVTVEFSAPGYRSVTETVIHTGGPVRLPKNVVLPPKR